LQISLKLYRKAKQKNLTVNQLKMQKHSNRNEHLEGPESHATALFSPAVFSWVECTESQRKRQPPLK